MNQISHRWQLGLLLSLITALMWGVLSINLTFLLTEMSAVTISWYRFLFSGLALLVWLAYKKQLPKLTSASFNNKKLFLLAAVSLTVNYAFYVLALQFLSPEAGQVVIQIAPFLLMFGGIWIYKEAFSHLQMLGAALLVVGYVLFFNQRVAEFLHPGSELVIGVIVMLGAGVSWAIYALAQKPLLSAFSSMQIMLSIYFFGVVALFPFANWREILDLSAFAWWLLVAASVNTLIAYGAFSEALAHWQASRVSAVVSITPLFTILFASVTGWLWPNHFQAEMLHALALVGAGLVALACLCAALGKAK